MGDLTTDADIVLCVMLVVCFFTPIAIAFALLLS